MLLHQPLGGAGGDGLEEGPVARGPQLPDEGGGVGPGAGEDPVELDGLEGDRPAAGVEVQAAAAVVLAAFAIVGISGRPCPRLIGQAERFPYGSVTGWINLRRAERRLVVLEFITVTTCSPPDLRHGRLVQGLQVRIPVCRVQERQQAFDLVGRGLT